MKRLIYLPLFLIIVMMSCSTKQTAIYTIASQNADCIGVAPQKCLLVKKGDINGDWEFFYSSIDGFIYEPGYEYVLEVKEEKQENVPADASSIKYTLVKEVSKTKKESENLPSSMVRKKTVYQCVGQVLSIETQNIGTGAAKGRFEAKVVKIRVSSSTIDNVKANDVIYCELIPSPRVQPVVGREYVFKSSNIHPAHAKGVYLLETDVMDLVV